MKVRESSKVRADILILCRTNNNMKGARRLHSSQANQLSCFRVATYSVVHAIPKIPKMRPRRRGSLKCKSYIGI